MWSCADELPLTGGVCQVTWMLGADGSGLDPLGCFAKHDIVQFACTYQFTF